MKPNLKNKVIFLTVLLSLIVTAVAGAGFASAIYAMRLGRKPLNQSFKRQLLGYP
jgi:hypothetical protein